MNNGTEVVREAQWAADWLVGSDWDALENDAGACFDGCEVEPDGHCEHGYRSVLLVLGII